MSHGGFYMGNIDYTEIGERIRKTRKKQRLTQEKASEICDITSAYYGNIERGDKKMSLETLVKITRGLDISADFLLFGDTTNELDEIDSFLKGLQRTLSREQFLKYLTLIKAVASVIDQI